MSKLENPFIDRRVKASSIHALSRLEEEECFKQLKANALKKCDIIVQEFVQCTKEHSWSAVFLCREKSKKMNKCLNSFTNQKELDNLKLAKIEEKIRKTT